MIKKLHIKTNKINRIAFLAVSLFMISVFVGVSLAALKKELAAKANIVTVGSIRINLSEETWDTLSEKEKVVYPNKEVSKDPRISNTGKNSAYTYLEVKIPMREIQIVNNEQIENKASTELFTYSLNAGWQQIERTVSSDNNYAIYIYGYTAKALESGETTPSLFDDVKFVNMLEGEIKQDTRLDIPIKAIAIQSDYLGESGTTMVEKMTDAYSKYKANIS